MSTMEKKFKITLGLTFKTLYFFIAGPKDHPFLWILWGCK